MSLRDKLLSDFQYFPETGIFKFRRARGRQPAGAVAGTINSQGYTIIGVGGRKLLAHRLAWLYVHGEIPSLMDHANGVRHDNRLSNLRIATPSQNVANTKTRNSTGLRGVSFYPNRPHKPWKAFISIGGKTKNLGSFASKRAAARAYDAAATAAFGEFARTNEEAIRAV